MGGSRGCLDGLVISTDGQCSSFTHRGKGEVRAILRSLD